MSFVLLLDPDPHHAAAVVGALRVISCKTLVASDLRNAIHLLSTQAVECVVMASVADGVWHHEVDAISHAAHELPDPPDIICLLRGPYRGPNDRVYAARKGVVLIHE